MAHNLVWWYHEENEKSFVFLINMKLFRDVVYFFKRKILPGFKIGRDELVIDIGSGDKPFWRADVFFDDASSFNNQRTTGTGVIRDLGLFVDGKLPNTPFKDKAFGFSYCSHLLEHVSDPDAALKEIMRISKRGYIEVPNGVLEVMEPFPSHLWIIYVMDNKLVFYRKSAKFHKLALQNAGKYTYLIDKTKDPFIRFFWDGKIDYEIVKEFDEKQFFYPESKNELNTHHNYQISRFYLYLVKVMRALFYSNKNLNQFSGVNIS